MAFIEGLFCTQTVHLGPGCLAEVAFIEGLFCTQTVHLGPGFLAVIQRWQGWLLREVPLCVMCVVCVDGVWSEAGLATLEDLTHSAAWRVVMTKIVTNTPTKIHLIHTSDNKV